MNRDERRRLRQGVEDGELQLAGVGVHVAALEILAVRQMGRGF